MINQCQVNVNAGEPSRPSALDIVQFNREQQKPYDRRTDDSIEQILLSHKALNRCQIRRTTKRRLSDSDQCVVSELACLAVDSQLRTARNYARLALVSDKNGDTSSAQEYYQRAMNTIPKDTLDWADYAFNVAIIHMTRGENQQALNLLQQALTIRNRFENQADELEKIQRAIDCTLT